MHRSDLQRHAARSWRTPVLWPAVAALAVVLAACSPAPSGASLSASQGGNPSPGGGLVGGSSASESASASPSVTGSGTLTGSWTGTWAIDPPYAGVAGGFTMEIEQTDGSFSGTVELTNSDCGNGTVNGSVSGTSVTFGWVTTVQPVQFTGTLDGTSKMSGTWSSVACSDPSISLTGTWEAAKS